MANEKHQSFSFLLCRPSTITVISLLFLLGVSSVASVPCDTKAVAVNVHQGEVVLECPLDANVINTKHSVVIKHFDLSLNYTGEVLGCDWLRGKEDIDCLPSRFGAKLLKIQADRVLARLPEDRLQQSGYFRCQLVPPESDKPFKDCNILCPESKEISTSAVPAIVDHHKTDAPKDLTNTRSHQSDREDFEHKSAICEELTAAVVILSIIVTILTLLILAAIIRFRSELKKHWSMLNQEKKGRLRPQSPQTGHNGQQSLTTHAILEPSLIPLKSSL